jgi:hypothetical protein
MLSQISMAKVRLHRLKMAVRPSLLDFLGRSTPR